MTTTSTTPYPPTKDRSSEILYGVEKAVGRGVYFMSNVREKMDIFFDKNAPSIVVDVVEYKNGYKDIQKRGGRIRAFTEITKDNVHYCKQLIKLVDELKHLEGVKGGVAVSESEYMATTLLQESTPLMQVIYSNVKEVVEQAQYIFDTLWKTAIPAEQKIRELEEGIVIHKTRIIENAEEIIREFNRFSDVSNEVLSCISAPGGLQYVQDYFVESNRKLIEKQMKGQHKGIRYICNIDNKYNADLARKFLQDGVKIRHTSNLPPMSFGITNKEIAVTFERIERGKQVQILLISDEPMYVKYFSKVFEELWTDSIDAQGRLDEIDQGIVVPSNIEIIRNPGKAIQRILEEFKNADFEIFGIIPTLNSFRRLVRSGSIQLLDESARKGLSIRILIPGDKDTVNQILEQEYARQMKENQFLKRRTNQSKSNSDYTNNFDYKIEIKCIDIGSQTSLGILVIDRKWSFIIETKDDTKDNSYDAAGLAIYSNSKHMALSYISILEFLWKQIEVAEQLKLHDRMKNEFVNMAAHELRTPIQPILGLADILGSKKGNIEQYQEFISIISRNARRLKFLTEDILDVSRIDGNSLELRNDVFDLVVTINGLLDDYSKDREGVANGCNISFKCRFKNAFVLGDRQRIRQVVHNLLDNALKFTKHGSLIVSLSEKTRNVNEWNIAVKDDGEGIDSEIMPRLFTKFATKSEHGIGLGLYISKSIIEAHGGKIWAKNNINGRGATFAFSLPQLPT
ncbi:MAG: HAMP domain-containing sensor histidine kinase [Nitrososphaeraceae archaeon]